jgi:8-oxo-dGTP pyrophosphatase MutT (NUDIX family)
VSRRTHLRALIDALAPSDDIERAHKTDMLALLDASSDVLARDHYVPGHFTASAFIVSDDRSSLLLILHGKLGLWLQPGGHIDPDDTDVIAAARREVAEEVGLRNLPLAHGGILDVDVHAIPARVDAPAHRHYDVRFAFLAPTGSGRAGSDARDARWVKLADLATLQTDESVQRAARKLGARR